MDDLKASEKLSKNSLYGEVPDVSEVEYLKTVINDLVRDLNWIYREPKLIGPITLNAILHVHEVKAWTVAKDALEKYVRHTQAWKAYQLDKSGLKVVEPVKEESKLILT